MGITFSRTLCFSRAVFWKTCQQGSTVLSLMHIPLTRSLWKHFCYKTWARHPKLRSTTFVMGSAIFPSVWWGLAAVDTQTKPCFLLAYFPTIQKLKTGNFLRYVKVKLLCQGYREHCHGLPLFKLYVSIHVKVKIRLWASLNTLWHATSNVITWGNWARHPWGAMLNETSYFSSHRVQISGWEKLRRFRKWGLQSPVPACLPGAPFHP